MGRCVGWARGASKRGRGRQVGWVFQAVASCPVGLCCHCFLLAVGEAEALMTCCWAPPHLHRLMLPRLDLLPLLPLRPCGQPPQALLGGWLLTLVPALVLDDGCRLRWLQAVVLRQLGGQRQPPLPRELAHAPG